jgi:anthranilate synthase component 2
MKIFVVDNYDSFTYNLVHMLRERDLDFKVARNDKFDLDEVDEYSHILLSPGPGIPNEAGLMPQVIEKFSSFKNILGVCLGHQAIAEAFGAELMNLKEVQHGIAAACYPISGDGLFKNMPQPFNVGRYHSWTVVPDSITAEIPLEITAQSPDGCVMAIKHKEFNVRGVQFHPESVLTEFGHEMIKNWLLYCD